MITICKQDFQSVIKRTYTGERISSNPSMTVVQATWTQPTHDLIYVRFEPSDRFTEYFYTHRWYNIFAVATALKTHKGWYCNIAEPARIQEQRIEQIDLLLDVWITPTGDAYILDQDEFLAAPLSDRQRLGAEAGLQALLSQLAERREPFSTIK